MTGSYQLPAGIYFSGSQFSILVWINVRSFNSWSRVIEVSNGPDVNNIALSITESTSGYPVCMMHIDANTIIFGVKSTIQLELNKWQHLACVFNSPNGFIYIDGVSYTALRDPFSSNPAASTRSSNFVGRSSWYPGDLDTNADIDELKIFNRALSQQELFYEMNNNMFL